MASRTPVRLTLALSLAMALSACQGGVMVPGSGSLPGTVPPGAIIAFSGGQIPEGWTVCDGRETPTGLSTPDLRDRFVLGSGPADVGQEGGSASHTHEATAIEPRSGHITVDKDNDTYATSTSHKHHVVVAEAEHLPPHVKLVYIMKD